MNVEKLPVLRIERFDGNVYVSFMINSIDEFTFERIADEMDELIRIPHPQSVVIDLTGVCEIDELGIALLRSIKESIKEVGGTAVIAGRNSELERSLSRIRPARDFKTRDSVDRPRTSTYW